MISKLAPQSIFPKNIQILEAWKPTEDRLEFFFSFTQPSTYELNLISAEKAKKLMFMTFWALYFWKY